MPRMLVASLTARPGAVGLAVRRWDLPSAPYPVPVFHGIIPAPALGGGDPVTVLRYLAELIAVAADRLEAERE